MSFKGRKFTVEHRKKLSEARKGVSPWNKGKKYPNSRIFTLEHRKNLSKALRGEKSSFWRGGKTIEHHRIRMLLDYRLWRTSVFERDNYTCQWCYIRGGNLQADHIKPFAKYPELRFAIDNGRTLCRDCHKKTDTWGRHGNNMTSCTYEDKEDRELLLKCISNYLE